MPRLCEFYPGICLTTEEKVICQFSLLTLLFNSVEPIKKQHEYTNIQVQPLILLCIYRVSCTVYYSDQQIHNMYSISTILFDISQVLLHVSMHLHHFQRVLSFFLLLLSAQQPPVGHGLVIFEVSRSHTTTHNSR